VIIIGGALICLKIWADSRKAGENGPSAVKTGLQSLGSAVYIVAVLVVIIVLKVWLRSGSDTPSRADFRDSIEQYAQEINKGLPAMVDENTRLDSVGRGLGGFFYSYTAVNEVDGNFEKQRFLDIMTPQLVETTCADSTAIAMMNEGYAVTYAYHDPAGTRIATITVEAHMCK
jgi:hypothetical protein